MTTLTPRPPIMVPFDCAARADGPLTLGQLNILEWLDRSGEPPYAVISATLELTGDTRVADVAETFAVLIARHEGLRTTYSTGRHPVQRVTAKGFLPIDVYAVSDSLTEADARALPAELRRQVDMSTRPPAAGLPVRVAIAVGSGTVRAAIMQCSHMAVDLQAIQVIKQEFREMILAPARRQVGEPRHQPLDLARAEHSAPALERAAAALRHWERQLRRMPQFLYAKPRTSPAGESVTAELSSPAGAMALRHVAARTRISQPSIVLAAVCALISRRTGYRELTFPMLSSNRFERRLVNYVGSLAQSCLVSIGTGEESFDRLALRTWAAVVEACRSGRYDVYQRAEIAERIRRERGVEFDYEPLFNNLVLGSGRTGEPGPPDPSERVRDAASRTALQWQSHGPARHPLIRFDLLQVEAALLLRLQSGDTGRVPRAEVESLLLAVERLIIAAAAADLDRKQINQALGVEPIKRGPDWLLIDSCWIEPAEVQRLLDDALAPAPARIFPVVDGQPLVAYVRKTAAVQTAADAHERCLAALPGRPTAMTPRRYVMCEKAPAELADLSGWSGMIA